jgi:hypothetical protein
MIWLILQYKNAIIYHTNSIFVIFIAESNI